MPPWIRNTKDTCTPDWRNTQKPRPQTCTLLAFGDNANQFYFPIVAEQERLEPLPKNHFNKENFILFTSYIESISNSEATTRKIQ